jgi:hypothetical protein
MAWQRGCSHGLDFFDIIKDLAALRRDPMHPVRVDVEALMSN